MIPPKTDESPGQRNSTKKLTNWDILKYNLEELDIKVFFFLI